MTTSLILKLDNLNPLTLNSEHFKGVLMKYFKRAQIYKANNVTFNPQTKEAYSYAWWKFVAVVDGKVVFNNYSYSPSTQRHQRNVSELINSLNIKVDYSVPVPQGLQTCIDLEEVFLKAEEQICFEFLRDEDKKIRRNERSQKRREQRRLAEFIIRAASHESHEAHMEAINNAKTNYGVK